MNIHIGDPLQILSKMQKQKIRDMVRKVWKDDESFYDHIESILERIYYHDTTKDRYNMIKFDFDRHTGTLRLDFERKSIEKEKDTHDILQQKLRQKIKNLRNGRMGVKSPAEDDPAVRMYNQLNNNLPVSQRQLIPTPDAVRANPAMYQSMMTMLPNQNPVYKYLSMFFPSS
jgi:hypothetical protein